MGFAERWKRWKKRRADKRRASELAHQEWLEERRVWDRQMGEVEQRWWKDAGIKTGVRKP